MKPDALTTAQLAEKWGMTARTVGDYIRDQKLIATKIGRRWWVELEDVERYEASRRNVQPVARKAQRRSRGRRAA